MFRPTGRPGELREHLGGKERVAIVGFCTTSREMAPYEDATFDIWGLNRGYIFMHRADCWFDMHGPHIVLNEDRRPGKHMEWLRGFPGPVYMHRALPAVPNSVDYPLASVAQTIGANLWRLDEKGGARCMAEAPYLSSSIAFEVALAIHEGYREIHLYGVDLQTDSEYAWQKPGVEHILGIAVGLGIKVLLPDNCPLLKGALYGRGYLSVEGERMSLEQLHNRIKALGVETEDVKRRLFELLGAERELTFMMDQLLPGLDHEKLDARRHQMEKAKAALQQKVLELAGAMKETNYWLSQTPAGQNPAQAIAQLHSNGHDADGPMDELDLIAHEPQVPVLAG